MPFLLVPHLIPVNVPMAFTLLQMQEIALCVLKDVQNAVMHILVRSVQSTILWVIPGVNPVDRHVSLVPVLISVLVVTLD